MGGFFANIRCHMISPLLSLSITPMPTTCRLEKVAPSVFSLKDPCFRGFQDPALESSFVERVVHSVKRAWMDSPYSIALLGSMWSFSNNHLFLLPHKLYAIMKKVVNSSFLLCLSIQIANSINLFP